MNHYDFPVRSFEKFKNRYVVNLKAKTEADGLLAAAGPRKLFLGYDRLHNQEVVIFRSHSEDDDLRRRKFKSGACPPHPNVARYTEGFWLDLDSDGADVVIMPYYPAGNAENIVSGKPGSMKSEQLDKILEGILLGIDHLHQYVGIIGNLSMNKILMAEFQNTHIPLITDYGMYDSSNVRYRAPELIRGDQTVSSRIDIWAFGVVLFRILTGKYPFGHSVESSKLIEHEILHKDMKEVFEQVASCPYKYREILKKCLERHPAERGSSVSELIRMLKSESPASVENNAIPNPGPIYEMANTDGLTTPTDKIPATPDPELKAIRENNTKKGSRVGMIVAVLVIAGYNIYRVYNPPAKPTYDQSVNTEQQQVYFKEFGWNITIPENFEKVSDQELAETFTGRINDLEASTGVRVEAPTQHLFIYRNGNNTIEAMYEIYKPDNTLSFEEVMNRVNEITVLSLMKSAPASMKMDTSHFYKTIDNQEFYVFRFKVDINSQVKYSGEMYRKLFKDKLLAVNILYINDDKGMDLRMAMKKSTFQKTDL